MGQAKRNQESGALTKKMRFIHLIQAISKYSAWEIRRFIQHRF